MAPPARILILGCGYTGQRLARRLNATHEVAAVVRSTESAASLRQAGIEALQMDLDDARARFALAPFIARAAMFYLVPPSPFGESDPRIGQFLNQIAEPPESMVYMSTTGVYGDQAGALVDETTPVAPVSARARRRAAAEDTARVWCTERQVRRVVLRVPGIYGPGRLPLERLQAQEPVVRAAEAGVSNRIHVEDLASVCIATLDKEVRGIYNVSDGNHISSTEFMQHVARIAGLPSPPEVSMDEAQLTFSPERLSFINESRRVSNTRLLRELDVKLQYADVDEGIRASL